MDTQQCSKTHQEDAKHWIEMSILWWLLQSFIQTSALIFLTIVLYWLSKLILIKYRFQWKFLKSSSAPRHIRTMPNIELKCPYFGEYWFSKLIILNYRFQWKFWTSSSAPRHIKKMPNIELKCPYFGECCILSYQLVF